MGRTGRARHVLRPHLMTMFALSHGRPICCTQVKAVVVNHGSFIEEDEVAGVKVPTMFNGSDNDRQISREKLEQFGTILKDKAGVPSDVKVRRRPRLPACFGSR